ncbi:hypothetical protein ACLEPN_36560 [Myxococcus sp. 1LA]
MLVPLRLRLAPGLAVASAVPITVFVWCFTLGPLLDGVDGVWRALHAAGPFAALVVMALVLEVPLLSLALGSAGMERRVPLSAMLGLATLPWMLGLMGTEVLMDRVLMSLPRLDTVEAGLVLAVSTGEAMAPRMLGAWTSTALLLGLALGQMLAHFAPSGFRENAGAATGACCWPAASPRPWPRWPWWARWRHATCSTSSPAWRGCRRRSARS